MLHPHLTCSLHDTISWGSPRVRVGICFPRCLLFSRWELGFTTVCDVGGGGSDWHNDCNCLICTHLLHPTACSIAQEHRVCKKSKVIIKMCQLQGEVSD